MYDRFDRKIEYLRISVTDRCNLRCEYCMPPEGISLLRHTDILTFDEIRDFTRVAVTHGVSKVRITGGEPLVRKGIVTLVEMLAEIPGISDLSMTTNAVLLADFASDLRKAGLRRVNISLDTVDSEKFGAITRGGRLGDVIRGIYAAREAGLDPIRINCVIQNNRNEPDAVEVAGFCRSEKLEIRYIRRMDLANGFYSVVEGGSGGDCSSCNRLRLTANGKLKPCLFNTLGFDVRELGYEKALQMAVAGKPECGSKNDTGTFYNIGG